MSVNSKTDVKDDTKKINKEHDVMAENGINNKDVKLTTSETSKVKTTANNHNASKQSDESSDESEVKGKDTDSDIDITVIEDDIDLEDLMRQKVGLFYNL